MALHGPSIYIRFAKVCSHVGDFMLVKNVYLQNFSNRVIGIINIERLSPHFIGDTMNRSNSMSDYNQGLSEPEFHCDLVHKFKKVMG